MHAIHELAKRAGENWNEHNRSDNNHDKISKIFSWKIIGRNQIRKLHVFAAVYYSPGPMKYF